MACEIARIGGSNEAVSDLIIEDRINIDSLIGRLKILLKEKHKTLRLPSNSKEILETCLRRRKFDLNEAADQVHAFLKLLYDMHEINESMYFLPSMHKKYFLDSFGMVLLKERDSKGRAVIWTDFAALKAQEFCLDKAMACGIMILNELTRMSLDIQRNGVVYVYNMKGFQFAHAKNFSVKRVQVMSRYLQGAIPVTFKAFHLVNSPRIFGHIYNLLIRPLLKSKIRNRIQFHGSDLTHFHEDVNREILPDILGGDQPLEECADLEFTNYFCSQDGYYKELLQYESPK